MAQEEVRPDVSMRRLSAIVQMAQEYRRGRRAQGSLSAIVQMAQETACSLTFS